MTGNGFFAASEGTYKIIYTVISVKGVFEKSTEVKVGAVLNITFPDSAEVGQVCTVLVSDADKAKYKFEITAAKIGGGDAEVSGFTFIPEEVGVYTVTVRATADGTTLTREFTLNVAAKSVEGAVAVFGAGAGVFSGADWKVTSTAETRIKDRSGRDANFLSVTAESKWINFYLTPWREKSYYETLAENGYEYVSVWVYLDGNIAHKIQVGRGPGSFYRTYEVAPCKKWTEIKIPLADDPKNDFEGSFLKAYDYYANGTQPFFVFDNSEEYNVGGKTEKSYKIYIGDIYAVKKGNVELSGKMPSFKAGDVADLTEFVKDGANLGYSLDFRGKEYFADGGNYAFTADGDYVLNISYDSSVPNRYGGVTLNFTVEPLYETRMSGLIKEKTGESVSVNMNEFNVELIGSAAKSVRYSLFKNGVEIGFSGSAASLKDLGMYTVEAEIAYEKDGAELKTYVSAYLDVFDEESKYAVFAYDGCSPWLADSAYINRGYDTVTAKTVTLDGKSGRYVEIEASAGSQRPLFAVRPMYSLGYYKNLLASNVGGDLIYSFEYMIDERASGNSIYSVYPNVRQTKTVATGVWTEYTSTLEEFVETGYNAMADEYDLIRGKLDGGIPETLAWRVGHGFLSVERGGVSVPLTVYISECSISVKQVETLDVPVRGEDIGKDIF